MANGFLNPIQISHEIIMAVAYEIISFWIPQRKCDYIPRGKKTNMKRPRNTPWRQNSGDNTTYAHMSFEEVTWNKLTINHIVKCLTLELKDFSKLHKYLHAIKYMLSLKSHKFKSNYFETNWKTVKAIFCTSRVVEARRGYGWIEMRTGSHKEMI